MSTSKVTPLEQSMFEKGYVSTRMAAYKLKRHRVTVQDCIHSGKFTAIRVGDRWFIEVKSIQDHYGALAQDMFQLNDWSDVFETDAEGAQHVRGE